MKLASKWNLRQIGLELLSYVLCFTTAVVAVPLAIKIGKFMEFGTGMYPGYQWPKTFSINFALQVFWEFTMKPIVMWLPLTLLADVCLRRFVYRLRES